MGVMKLIVWENTKARVRFPLEAGFNRALCEVARNSISGVLLGLRVKVETKWVPLSNFADPAPHTGNWLRDPPRELQEKV